MSLSLDESIESFTITFKREIIFYLRQLINDGDPISVSFNEGHDTILTLLLMVDEERGMLYFDWGSSEEVNQRFLKSERNFFVALPHGIRNQFMTGIPRQVNYKGRPAFAVPLPDKYVRLQRREFFRLVLPMTQRPVCTITQPGSGQTMQLEVVDIGIGGVGLNAQTLAFPLDSGAIFEKTKIELKGVGELIAPIEIRHVDQITKGTKNLLHIGCLFTKLSAGQENLLQKFMANIQRDERTRLGG